MKFKPPLWTIVLVAIVATIAVLRPWTVRSLDSDDAALGAAFNAGAFAESIWRERIDSGAAAALDPAATTNAAAFVRGEGRVLSLNDSSRARLLLLDLAPGDGAADVAIQIGPVVRGTALRDAAGLGFADFANQIDYANAAAALNDRAIANIAALNDADALVGRSVQFVGAGVRGADNMIDVVPLRLDVAP